jgi:hypothetical protein
MTTTKKANIKGRATPVSPSPIKTAGVDEVPSEVIALSVRLPKPMHDSLRRIVFEEGNRGNRISIHSLVLDGITKVIAEKR